MTGKGSRKSDEEIGFDNAMRALVRVPKSEVEELEKREVTKARAGSASKKRRKVRNQAA